MSLIYHDLAFPGGPGVRARTLLQPGRFCEWCVNGFDRRSRESSKGSFPVREIFSHVLRFLQVIFSAGKFFWRLRKIFLNMIASNPEYFAREKMGAENIFEMILSVPENFARFKLIRKIV